MGVHISPPDSHEFEPQRPVATGLLDDMDPSPLTRDEAKLMAEKISAPSKYRTLRIGSAFSSMPNSERLRQLRDPTHYQQVTAELTPQYAGAQVFMAFEGPVWVPGTYLMTITQAGGAASSATNYNLYRWNDDATSLFSAHETDDSRWASQIGQGLSAFSSGAPAAEADDQELGKLLEWLQDPATAEACEMILSLQHTEGQTAKSCQVILTAPKSREEAASASSAL